ncbi:MAG: putative DNA binding domain-containing protein [Lachnospiraceae bacterium]|nr:putative DNA binding domain-containing protein [Lachnospiraceae bacterium]
MRENKGLEFKETITNTFLKTVSAFSNFNGGTIMFGVDDKGNIKGLDNADKLVLDIENKINDSISPKPDYSMSVNKRNGVISLKVSEGKYKPYLYKGKAYRRSDTATIEVDQLELKRLTLEGANLYYEKLSCGKEDLKFSYFELKFKEKLGIKKMTDDMLRTLGFYDEDLKYNIVAALFSDSNEYSGIDIARFGNTINEILDRENLSGISILEQYDRAVRMYERYYTFESIDGIERKKVENIPEAAFREAVANALVHRTWDINANIRILMFQDKIEIISPGGLPKGITKEEYLNGYISNLRNPIIGNIFFRLNLIEMFGTGIRRIIDVYKNEMVKPVFEVTDNSVKVVLPCINAFNGISLSHKKVMDVIRTVSMSSREISETLGWSKDKTVRILNELLAKGYIEKNGAGRGTRYVKHL